MQKLQNVSEARNSFLQPNCRNDVSWQSFKSNLCYICNKTMLYITNSPSRVITRALRLRCTITCTICMYHSMTRIQTLCYFYYCLLLFKSEVSSVTTLHRRTWRILCSFIMTVNDMMPSPMSGDHIVCEWQSTTETVCIL